jgi:hypothetical protein
MIFKVGEFYKGQMVIFDGEICKIENFPTRKMAILENLDRRRVSNGDTWSGKEAPIRKIKRVGFVDDEILKSNMGIVELLASIIARGFRDRGLACVAKSKGGEIDLTFAAHRPVPYMRITTNVISKYSTEGDG